VYDNAQTIKAARRIIREWTPIERTSARKVIHRERNSTDLLYTGIASKAARNTLAKIPSTATFVFGATLFAARDVKEFNQLGGSRS
jgi:hypothetical protein